jgi:hypothetical protein
LKSTLKVVRHDIPAGAAPAPCPSCHAQAQDNFCSHCGEATRAHPPSAGEFIHEFIGHYVALEGKLWETLRLLMFRPGRLTIDYLRGRRVPSINPLRLYLSLSLLMFALVKLNGVDLPQLTMDQKSLGAAYTHTGADPAAPKRIGTVTLAITAEETSDDKLYTVREGIRLLGSANAGWAKNAQEFMHAPPAEKADILNHGFLANLPYMLIGALPLFALYLKLIYWRSGRRYGEHLVFALHASAFAFLLASVMILIPGNLGWLVACLYQPLYALITPWDWVQLLPVLWSLAYLPAALRAVYGGGRWANWGRSLVLMSVHLLVVGILIIGAEVIAILKHG